MPQTHKQDLADSFQHCHDLCLESLDRCLDLGGEYADPHLVRMLSACADICDASARFLPAGSRYLAQTCKVCAEVCEACASDCDRIAGDKIVRQCADACRACASACRKMSIRLRVARRVWPFYFGQPAY
jgi:hypothetical protein